MTSPVNLSARSHRVIIGAQDWSPYFSAIEGNYDEVGEDGLVKLTVTLTLNFDSDNVQVASGLPSIPFPRFNKGFWARGQSVFIQIRNTAGNIVDHPFARLILIRRPEPPTPENPEIKLDLGCKITYQAWRNADANKSAITIGTAKPSEQLVAQWLALAKISGVGISGLGYNTNYPLPKTAGSFVTQAGQYCRDRNSFLYQRKDGVVASKQITLSGAADITFTVGVDAIDFLPSGNSSEIPSDKLRLSAITYDLSNVEIESLIDEESDIKGNIDPTACGGLLGSCDDETLSKRTTTDLYPFNGAYERVVVTIELPRSQTNDPSFSPPYNLIYAESSEEKTYFDEKDRKLKVETEFRQRRDSLGDIPTGGGSPSAAILVRRTTISFTYEDTTIADINFDPLNPKSQLSSRTTITVANPVLMDGSRSYDPSDGLQNESQIVERWTRLKLDRWNYKVTYKKAKILIPTTDATEAEFSVGGSSDFKLVLSQATESRTSNNGQTQPPAPDYREPLKYSKEKVLRAEVLFGDVSIADSRPRDFPIQLDYAVSVAQLQAYGQIYGKLLIGREFGWRCVVPLTDTFLADYSPLMRIDIIDPIRGYRFKLCADGLTIATQENETKVAFNGIEIGAVALAAPDIDIPTTKKAVGGDGNFVALRSIASGGVIRSRRRVDAAGNFVALRSIAGGVIRTIEVFGDGNFVALRSIAAGGEIDVL